MGLVLHDTKLEILENIGACESGVIGLYGITIEYSFGLASQLRQPAVGWLRRELKRIPALLTRVIGQLEHPEARGL